MTEEVCLEGEIVTSPDGYAMEQLAVALTQFRYAEESGDGLGVKLSAFARTTPELVQALNAQTEAMQLHTRALSNHDEAINRHTAALRSHEESLQRHTAMLAQQRY